MDHHKHDFYRLYLPAFYLISGYTYYFTAEWFFSGSSPQEGITAILGAFLIPCILWSLAAPILLVTQFVRNLGEERKILTTLIVHRITLGIWGCFILAGSRYLFFGLEKSDTVTILLAIIIILAIISAICMVPGCICYLIGHSITRNRLKKLASRPALPVVTGKITIK